MEHLSLLVFLSDGCKLNSVYLLFNGQGETSNLLSSGSRFKLFSGGIVDKTLLWLVFTSGENDELALVSVESCNVQLKLLLACASSSVINRNSDGSGECSCQTSALQFSKSEASSVADLTSILTGGLGDNRAKTFSRSGEDTGGLSDSILVSFDLLCRLVEVSFGSSLPVFTKMDVDDHVVVLDHC